MSVMELIPARPTTTLTVLCSSILSPTVCAADDGYFSCWYSQKAWYDTSMATARFANSNTVKPLTEKTYQQGGTPARRQAFPPSLTDFVLTSCDGLQNKQHFAN
ncbi:hypothetical protein sscle_05g044610 [Sclerotinia sclerotiorum 1980 UF-70]|uniref:Uncharacterized protein n=1 Tax=Sclerotinia sclerotiorum (strain ATCC 18683 / 1980 / Ss-1) TaxID=665079 RepID=A0A1D9Q401_SCLS1|nr:hypothetical protein sscle_05g044610 [Sclerotinia sclerotiorum 1980 UF-70]